VTAPAKVHYDRDGRARCGRRNPVLTRTKRKVTCRTCRNILAGTHGIGNRQPDNDWCGTTARYRWHLRHEGKPVRCESCLQAERRQTQDNPAREAYNARRRQRRAAARARSQKGLAA
jgi:hypothetical protein